MRITANWLLVVVFVLLPLVAQGQEQECRQRYDAATGKVYYGCAPKAAPAVQVPTEWDGEPQGHPATPAPNPLLAQWEDLHRRAWGDTRLDDAVAEVAAQLKAQGWCHAFPTSTHWYRCDRPLPDEQQAAAQYNQEERQSYAQSFIAAATGLVRDTGANAWEFARKSGLFERCRDPQTEGINCALTVAQRQDLFQQIVNYYQSLGPRYTLHE